MLLLLLLIPLLTAVAMRLAGRLPRVERLNVAGAGATLVVAAVVVVRVVEDGPQRGLGGVLYVDALSALLIAMTAVIGAAAALASLRYLRHDLDARHVPDGPRGVCWYYVGLHAFIASILATLSFDNLGLLWVGIEATTLASALLVGFYRTEAALEAAWKYLILCTVGITFALFGVILTYYAGLHGGLSGTSSLNWTVLSQHAGQLDPAMMRLAFVFVLVGFGTKAGFAPLHTWLADAHSQAPSPVSALLSGVLLTCALYGILRFHVITTVATGSDFSAHLLIAFGLLSVAVAVPFILIQRDLKRLLAYSSVEHIGLMAVAFGIGGPVGFYAGLLHMVNHAATKSALFFVSGDVIQRFGSRRIGEIRGALAVAPLTGWLLLLGVFAIAGVPPFSIFVSELGIVSAGFGGGHLAVAVTVPIVLLLGAVFAGMVAHTLRVVYGTAPAARRLPQGSAAARPSSRLGQLGSLVALAPLAVVMLLFAAHVPAPVDHLFTQVSSILEPVTVGSVR